MSKYDVVSLGELLIDFTDNGISEQGNPVLEANPGGAVTNVLSMLQKLGRKTAYIGKVGKDGFGEQLKNALVEQNIDIRGLRFDDEIHTTLAIVLKRPNGDRDFAFYRNPGADMMLKPEEVETDLIKEARIFHTGTLSLTDPGIEETHKFALNTAKESGCLISLDPNLRLPLWKDTGKAREMIGYSLSMCDITKISDEEIEFMTGEKDIEKGARIIKEKYDIPFLCATLGPDGSIAFWKDLAVYGRPYHSDKTIETTGAGDTFCACMLNGILERGLENWDEGSLRSMLEYANAAACLVTTRKGALRVMPSVEEIEGFIRCTRS